MREINKVEAYMDLLPGICLRVYLQDAALQHIGVPKTQELSGDLVECTRYIAQLGVVPYQRYRIGVMRIIWLCH